MGEGQEIQGIIGGILAIVGILLPISGGDLWGRKPKWSISLGLALSGVGLFMLITSFPQYAIGFSVLATLALAFAAFLTIKEADTREQRHRNNELLKEKRDKDERLLNEIIEWAEDIRKSSSESIDPNEIIFDTPIEQMATQRGFYNLRLRYQAISVKSEYMEGIAKKVFGNELLSATEIVTQKLGEIIDVLKDYLTNRRASQKEKGEKVETYKKSLDSYAEDLIEEATKIKIKDIG